jgi:hypothetical protein
VYCYLWLFRTRHIVVALTLYISASALCERGDFLICVFCAGVNLITYPCLPALRISAIFSFCVPILRCSGKQHSGLLHIWRIINPLGISPYQSSYINLCIIYLSPRYVKYPYPLEYLPPFHIQQLSGFFDILHLLMRCHTNQRFWFLLFTSLTLHPIYINFGLFYLVCPVVVFTVVFFC